MFLGSDDSEFVGIKLYRCHVSTPPDLAERCCKETSERLKELLAARRHQSEGTSHQDQNDLHGLTSTIWVCKGFGPVDIGILLFLSCVKHFLDSLAD